MKAQAEFHLGIGTLLLVLGHGSALAATITVSPTCTIAAAVTAANTDTASGDCPAGVGADTIVLPANSVNGLSIAEGALETLGLQVTSEIIIMGNGATISRAPALPELFRIFTVEFNGDLMLQQVTVTGGQLPPGFMGGGIRNDGTLTVIDSTISNNDASQGAGIHSSGTLTVSNSTITRNIATAGTDGGGVFNGGTAILTNNTISGNSNSLGGGLFNTGGTATLIHNTIVRNAADLGGGVLNQGTLTLRGNLVSGNTSPDGAQINNTQGVGTVGANTFNLLGFNGLSGVVGFVPTPTNVVPAAGVTVAKILGPLASNGGPTQTHALVAASPALNAVKTGCPPPMTDQRATPRPGTPANRCDIGSFELTGAAPPVCPPAAPAP